MAGLTFNKKMQGQLAARKYLDLSMLQGVTLERSNNICSLPRKYESQYLIKSTWDSPFIVHLIKCAFQDF